MPNFITPEDKNIQHRKMYVDKDFHIKYNNAVFPEELENPERFVTQTKSTYKADSHAEQSHINPPLIPKLLP